MVPSFRLLQQELLTPKFAQAPAFEDTAKFLANARADLSAAYLICQTLRDKLNHGGAAVRSGNGYNESVWIKQQARELMEGIADLEDQLKSFREEKLRFRNSAFRRRDTEDATREKES